MRPQSEYKANVFTNVTSRLSSPLIYALINKIKTKQYFPEKANRKSLEGNKPPILSLENVRSHLFKFQQLSSYYNRISYNFSREVYYYKDTFTQWSAILKKHDTAPISSFVSHAGLSLVIRLVKRHAYIVKYDTSFFRW